MTARFGTLAPAGDNLGAMRILFVSHARKNPDGGASRVYHLLEEGLRDRGHVVRALHYDDLGIRPSFEKPVSRLFLPQAAASRAGKEALGDYDVIMSSSGMLYPLFKKLHGRTTRPLLVSHLHGLSYFDHQAIVTETMRGHMATSWMYRLIIGRLPVQYDFYGSQYGDLTVTQNGRDLDFLTEKGIAPVIRIPLPVHPSILEAGRHAPQPEVRDPMALLWFGSWVERKGRHYLPSAFEAMVKAFPAAILTVGGTGMSEEAVKSCFKPSLRASIVVLPRITLQQQIEVYATHSIFLFPSLSEGFGFALAEAMSMGLAAVTTDTGLAGDYLRDGLSAVIVPASSSLHLAKGVNSLLADAPLRMRLAREGQKIAQTFTYDSFVDSYEQIFLEGLRARQPA
jgi:glycosyltransferase involved in cell wall biosynthesis